MTQRSFRTALLGIAAVLACAGTAAQPAASPNPLDAVPDKMPFDIPYGTPITLERAEAAIAAAVAESKRRDWKMNIAVVDGGGNLIAFQRMDGVADSLDRDLAAQGARGGDRSGARPRRSRAASRAATPISSRSTASSPRAAASRSSKLAN